MVKQATVKKLKRQFVRMLPRQSVLTSPEELKPYECDGLSAYTQIPLMVVIPDSIEQIQQIIKICVQLDVPIVARGAGTGLSGGALPLADSVILSLTRLSQILEVDAINRTARVQPGVRNLAISEAVAPLGLYYAPDPSSQIACTIGGNVAENSGGVHCLKYGLTVHNIFEIKVVTMDGELMTLGGSGLDSPGYDLLALFIGSEGLLGVIVEVVVKLLPKPETTSVILSAFDSVEKAGHVVAEIIKQGVIPAGLEMMDKFALRAAEEFVNAGYPLEAEAILLCELDGIKTEVTEQTERVKQIMSAGGAFEVRLAEDETQRQLFWKGRKAAFPAMGRVSPDYYCMDGTIPRRCLPEVLAKISKFSEKYGLAVANVFHAGDGNLHPLILYDANKTGDLESAEKFGAEILELCVSVGGTITGEHGVGVEKLDQMCSQFAQDELTIFHQIKSAFDPSGLLNPGKAIPSLHRCAELGAMHVHNGKLRFPELDRF